MRFGETCLACYWSHTLTAASILCLCHDYITLLNHGLTLLILCIALFQLEATREAGAESLRHASRRLYENYQRRSEELKKGCEEDKRLMQVHLYISPLYSIGKTQSKMYVRCLGEDAFLLVNRPETPLSGFLILAPWF